MRDTRRKFSAVQASRCRSVVDIDCQLTIVANRRYDILDAERRHVDFESQPTAAAALAAVLAISFGFIS